MYSEVVLPKSKITYDILNNITSNFGVVMQVSLRKAKNQIATKDIKIPTWKFCESNLVSKELK
jgi:hypothetical protein